MRKKRYLLFWGILSIMCCLGACNKQKRNIDSANGYMTKNTDNTEKKTVSDYNESDSSWKTSSVNNYNDDNMIMYCDGVGFINKQGNVFRIGENQSCYFKFNGQSLLNTYYDYDGTGRYGECAVVAVLDRIECKTNLYYLDSRINPVLLSTVESEDYYNVMLHCDISADGKWVLYRDNSKSLGNMGRKDDFDLHLYNVDNASDMIVTSNAYGANFTLDGEHIVYCEMSQDYVDNGNTDNMTFTILDLKTMSECGTYAANEYGVYLYAKGLWEVRDNGDILIFNESFTGLESTLYPRAVYLIRNGEFQELIKIGNETYDFVVAHDMNEMFVIDAEGIRYYNVDDMQSIEISGTYKMSMSAWTTRNKLVYNIDSFDNCVFAAEDGIYLWDSDTLKLEKLLNMDWRSRDAMIINYSESDAIIAIDDSKIYRIENLSIKPQITTIFSISEGNIEDTMYDILPCQPLDDNIWFYVHDENTGHNLYAVDKDGIVLHKISGSISYSVFNDIEYLPFAKQYILLGDDYRGEEHIYSADSNCDEVRLIDVREVDEIYTYNSIWMVYSLTDGTVCMYNGENVVNLDLMN